MGVNDITSKQFSRQLELAIQLGFKFVPALEIAKTGGKSDELAVTFDDGLKSVKTQAAPILKSYRIPWSLYAVSEWTESGHPWGKDFALTWDDLSELVADGVDLGSHSATHPDFGTIGSDQMHYELEGSRRMFEKRLGTAPPTFAIPLGQSMNWSTAAQEAAKSAGYSIVYAQAEETRPPGTIARTFVTRFDHDRLFKAILRGAFDRWEEWF
jgi:peptidoglycan/xylan/chitin deacetylase (PgdA/CDA1 family)